MNRMMNQSAVDQTCIVIKDEAELNVENKHESMFQSQLKSTNPFRWLVIVSADVRWPTLDSSPAAGDAPRHSRLAAAESATDRTVAGARLVSACDSDCAGPRQSDACLSTAVWTRCW